MDWWKKTFSASTPPPKNPNNPPTYICQKVKINKEENANVIVGRRV